MATRAEAYKELRNLLPYEYNGSFREGLEDALTNYKKLVESLDEAERLDDWDSVLEKVDNIIALLLSAVDLYYSGKHEDARLKVDSVLQAIKTVSSIYWNDSGCDFYRMRKVDYFKNMKFTEMFHIPLDKRGIVSTQRFSMPGYPCLYLGRTIYACWEEMGRPSLNSCVFSRFRSTKRFQTFDLSIPRDEAWCKGFEHVVYRMPLIIACMIKVKNKNDVFKPEYIIPQLVTECVIEKSIAGFYGISYTSVEICIDFGFLDDCFLNLALPVVNASDSKRKYCPELSSLFNLTKPTSYEVEKIRNDFEGPMWHEIRSDSTPEQEAIEAYKESAFGRLENRLKEENIFPLQKMPDE